MSIPPWRVFWIVMILGSGWGIEVLQTDSIHPLVHALDLASLSLPSRVSMIAPIARPRSSGPALVFDVPLFALTCYFRHPPSSLSVFSGDIYDIRARIEFTPTGKLCVVQEMRPHVDS